MADELSCVQCVTKAEFDPSTLGATFVALNGSGLSDSVKVWKLYNGSETVAIELSLDGVNPHDFIPPLGTCIIDFQTNHYDGGTYGTGTLVLRKGQIIYGREAPNPDFLQMIGFR